MNAHVVKVLNPFFNLDSSCAKRPCLVLLKALGKYCDIDEKACVSQMWGDFERDDSVFKLRRFALKTVLGNSSQNYTICILAYLQMDQNNVHDH